MATKTQLVYFSKPWGIPAFAGFCSGRKRNKKPKA